MASPTEDIIDYLRYRKECGESTIELDSETLEALAEFASLSAPAVNSAAPVAEAPASVSRPSVSSQPQFEPKPQHVEAVAVEKPQTTANGAPDFLIVGASDGDHQEGAGEQMRKIIKAMGYDTAAVPVLNICGGADPTRAPTAAEMAEAMPAFKARIASIKPKIIISMGESALLGLVGKRDLSSAHGTWFTFEGIPLLPTFHPAYMVKFVAAKREAVRDMERVLERLGKPIPWRR